MRKFQISLPQHICDRLEELATQEHRLLRQQAEFLLCQAIQQAARAQQCAQETDAVEGLYAPAQQS